MKNQLKNNSLVYQALTIFLQYMIQNTIKIIGVKNGFQNDEGYSIKIPENGRVKILMTDRDFSGICGKGSSLIALF